MGMNRLKVVLAEKQKMNIWLADRIGKNKTTISLWCTNQRQPSLETLFEIAHILDVDVRQLIVSTKKTI